MGKVLKLKQTGFSGLAEEKILSSGLTCEQAAALGMYDVANASTVCPEFEIRPAIVIPYHDVHGAPLKAHPKWPDFYRIRYLGQPHDFAKAAGKKENRYKQPAESGMCAYFANCMDWAALRADARDPILITEGEFKSAKSCLEGFPTIGLGGVWNFCAKKNGILFLPELEQFNWVRRKVTILYDSDYETNTNICTAINALAEELQARGALVYVAFLPNVYQDENKKTGLDDFLIERGDDALVEVLKKAVPLGMTKRLWEMNEEVVYVRDPGMVVVQATHQKMDPSKFSAHSDWATQAVPEFVLRPNGAMTVERGKAAPVWIAWPLRRAVDKLTYQPGQGRFYSDDKLSYLNQWKGWGCEPKKGDVTPWLDLNRFIFAGAEKGAMEWFLDWAAYPIQFPGTKLFSASIIHGRMTGTGKTLIGYSLGRVYGTNFIKIKREDLSDTWWAENRQFVLGDEISGSDKRAEADAMKAMITQEEMNVNIKYIPQFSIPDCVNYYLTSNHVNALFLEDEDRRLFVHEVMHKSPLPLGFYTEYDKWINGKVGPSALMQWALDRDLSKFNPKAPAFKTAARDRMIRAGKGDLALWCAELREAPVDRLRVGSMRHVRDLFTSKELLGMYERDHPSAAGKVTVNGMSNALRTAGFVQAYDGKPINDKWMSVQGRYFIIRNIEKWEKVKDGKILTRHVGLQPVRD